jgi:hypothetical protein
MRPLIAARKCLQLIVILGIVALLSVSTAAASAPASPGWFLISAGTAGCTGVSGPYTASATLNAYIRGDYPSGAPVLPRLDRYIDRLDVQVGCVDAIGIQVTLTDGTVVQGIALPGTDRTLYESDLASLGIRFKVSDLLSGWGEVYPAPPPPYAFVIAP